MKSALILILCSLTSWAQTKPPKGIDLLYDRFKEQSQASFHDIGGSGPSFTAWFQFNGKRPTKDVEEFYFSFEKKSGCQGYCFTGKVGLILLVDKEPLFFPEQTVATDEVTFVIHRSLLKTLTKAKKIEIQVGRFEAVWKEKNISKLQSLLELGTVKRSE